jgi:hypothetical protein
MGLNLTNKNGDFIWMIKQEPLGGLFWGVSDAQVIMGFHTQSWSNVG